jgi:NADP-dependent aldehyde dehydrogenase
MESSIIGFSRGDASAKTFKAVNPANNASIDINYAMASAEEVDEACRMAGDAAIEMAQFSGCKKAEFLNALADGIDGIVEELVPVMTAETGLPEPRVRAETGRTSGQLRMFAKLVKTGSWVDARIDRAQPDRQPLPKPDLRAMLRPVGPVAVFCASNFPLAFSVAGGDSASAWAAGCPVIVKAHHAHPGTALLIGNVVVSTLRKCNWPEGAFSLLFGEGRTVGQSLVKNKSIKAVGFTGSRSGGRALFDLANAREEPIPVFAEMSSINPIFIMPGMKPEDMDSFVSGLAGSATLGVGQFCTNPGIVFHPSGEFGEQLKSAYVEKMKKVGAGVMLHQGICDSYNQGIQKLTSCEGVNVEYRFTDSTEGKGSEAGPCVLSTTVKDFLEDSEMMDEVFGPSTLLVAYDDLEQLVKVVSTMEGQLTASIFGVEEDLKNDHGLVDHLEIIAGRILFNQFPTGVEVCESVVHGGPYPATTDGRSTSVGTGAILRFARPVCYQGFPDEWLPDELKEGNPLGLQRCES